MSANSAFAVYLLSTSTALQVALKRQPLSFGHQKHNLVAFHTIQYRHIHLMRFRRFRVVASGLVNIFGFDPIPGQSPTCVGWYWLFINQPSSSALGSTAFGPSREKSVEKVV